MSTQAPPKRFIAAGARDRDKSGPLPFRKRGEMSLVAVTGQVTVTANSSGAGRSHTA